MAGDGRGETDGAPLNRRARQSHSRTGRLVVAWFAEREALQLRLEAARERIRFLLDEQARLVKRNRALEARLKSRAAGASQD